MRHSYQVNSDICLAFYVPYIKYLKSLELVRLLLASVSSGLLASGCVSADVLIRSQEASSGELCRLQGDPGPGCCKALASVRVLGLGWGLRFRFLPSHC